MAASCTPRDWEVAGAEAGVEAGAKARPEAPRGMLGPLPSRVVRAALGEAAEAGDSDRLHALLVGTKGEYLNSPCDREGSRWTALHWAASAGHTRCVKLLLRYGANASTTADGGQTALHVAAAGGSADHAATARMLLRCVRQP